jgi:hypothetical protein
LKRVLPDSDTIGFGPALRTAILSPVGAAATVNLGAWYLPILNTSIVTAKNLNRSSVMLLSQLSAARCSSQNPGAIQMIVAAPFPQA